MSVGDCYEANGKLFMDLALGGKTGVYLVHGEVTGSGGPVKGKHFGHAWVEQGDTVLDVSNGRNVRISRDAYYLMGRIGENLHRYTWKQALRWMNKTEHWGPWELKTSTGM